MSTNGFTNPPGSPSVDGYVDGVEPIAIVGLACRVPGAADIGQFWDNLSTGVESIRSFSADEALAAGASPRAVADPQHVGAAPVLDDIENFDAALFGMSKREAEILDPQHRVFLECAFAALEHAGYDSSRYPGEIGVYGGVGAGEYQWYHLLADRELVSRVGHMAIALSNNTDYASTMVSYKLNLRGPSLSVSTACSTGLVAIHLACEAVRNGECDMALAGAASVELTQLHGYVFHEGSILSPDGHCRAFDEQAKGTLWGSGGGVVVLKRLSEALADGDTVHAVILGSAINNDGSDKVGFSAPSVSGQAEVIRQAMGVAGVFADTIDYVEAHGTGTTIGDPIEIKALTMAFGNPGRPAGSCLIGTVKPNIGHLAAAAGVVGLIKTVLSLENEVIPPTLHFTRPNPAIDFASTPFQVVATPQSWPRNAAPRRAGVSSFGMGGTNAHAVVEEAPAVQPRTASGEPRVVMLSARSQTALDTMTADLAIALRARPDVTLDDVAHTLQVGRRVLEYRKALVANDVADAAGVLSGAAPRRLLVGRATANPRLVMMFPGQGTQRVGMAAELYQREPIVRDYIDRGAELLRPLLGFDLRVVLFAAAEDAELAAERLNNTAVTQPALFVVEYALAQLWISWGVQPLALIGHSLGEYVAACVAGVFSFDDGVRLVAARARLMQSMPAGAMLAVQVDAASLDLESTDLDLAAVNSADSCVVSGPTADVDDFERHLTELGVPVTRLRTSHAFHSRLMEPVRDAFVAVLAQLHLQPPRLPVMSNLTGQWLTAEQAVDPDYWADHLRSAVQFGPGLQTILADGRAVLLEVGPGQALTGLARTQLPAGNPDPVVTFAPKSANDQQSWLAAAARLWTLGVTVDWTLSATEPGVRLPLPGHPFERERFWIDSDIAPGSQPPAAPLVIQGQQAPEDWFWVPVWKETPRVPTASTVELPAGPWLVLRDEDGFVDGVVERLRARGDRVVVVSAGAEFDGAGDAFVIRPEVPADYDRLLECAVVPRAVLHAWTLGGAAALDADQLAHRRPLAFDGLVWLAQALAGAGQVENLLFAAVTRGTQDVVGGDLHDPIGAMISGPLRVLPQELPGLTAIQIDLDRPETATVACLTELTQPHTADLVAYRHGRRWVPDLAATPLTAAQTPTPIRENGVYLITGGLGGLGLSIAVGLARRGRVRLVLVGRSVPPARQEWAGLIQANGRGARQLAELLEIESLGSEVLIVGADITDPAQVRRARDEGHTRFGVVNGIVHAAGVAGGTLLEAQSPAIASAVLGPKTAGTVAIIEAFRGDRLDFLALFSSVTAVAGGLGQLDYCAANAFLDAVAHTDGQPWPIISMNWGAWLEVGMAAKALAPAAFLELAHGIHRRPVGHTLLDVVETREDSNMGVNSVELSSATHWVVDEHRIAGVPALPGTAYLEMVRAAFAAATDSDQVLELRDVVFLTPLAVPDGSTQTVQLVIDDTVKGGDWRVQSARGGETVEHARGTVHWVAPAPVAVTDVDAVANRCPVLVLGEATGASASGLLSFGPRWTNLKAVMIGDGEELAELSAGDLVRAELGDFGLHPALLDEATSFGSFSGASGSYLPLGYGRITVRAPLPARVFSHLRHRRGGSAELLTCDITLLDESGAVLVEIADFMLRRIDADEMSSLGAADTDSVSDGPAGQSAMSDRPAGPQVGIAPHDGVDAFLKVLGSRLGAQVAITATHFPTLIRSVRDADRNRMLSEIGDRLVAGGSTQALDLDFVPPTTELQRKLITLWEQAIGVTGIGIEHNFFDLGGNSLVAAQLIARVRSTMQLKVPMRVLFESPTVAGMAEMIEAGIAAAS